METRLLPVKLNEEEKLLRGHELSVTTREADEAEGLRKRVAKEHKEKVDTLMAKRAELARVVEQGEELRHIPVVQHRDDARCTIVTVRQDTGETVDVRPMTDQELADRQLALLGHRGGKKMGKLPTTDESEH